VTMVAHVLIVEFGGLWFQTTGLTWQQWLVCLGFGVSELLWAQVSPGLHYIHTCTCRSSRRCRPSFCPSGCDMVANRRPTPN
jgi:hypothetical protein